MQEAVETTRDILLVIFLGLGLLVALGLAVALLMLLRAAGRARQSIARSTRAVGRSFRGWKRPALVRKRKKRRRTGRWLPLRPGFSWTLAFGGALALTLAEAQPSRPAAQRESPGPRIVPPAEEAKPPEGSSVTQQFTSRRGLIGLGKHLYQAYKDDDLGTIAASLAYRFFLALFPFFIFLAALSGFIARMIGIQDPTGQIIDLLGRALPPESAELIGGQLGAVVGSQNSGLLSIGIIGAIWAASSGVQAFMKGVNLAYDVPESRPFWKKYPIAIGLTLLGGLFVILATVLFFTGQFWAMDILGAIGIEQGWLAMLISWLRWPVIIALVMLAMAFLYWAAPNIDLPFRLITPGAVIFVIAWLVASIGFAYYVSNFGSYNATYGALGGVVILLVWLYFSSLLMLIGAEINAIVNNRAEPQQMAERRAAVRQKAA